MIMDAMEEQYGYDANFIGEVLDFFKCVVCHLVLRQPVQIITCGHHFCKPCFERLEGYSKHLNTELCCPIDREVVDVNQVFESTGIAREIGNFQVKCSYLNLGCPWQGDLRNLQEHEKDCQYKIKLQHEQKPECAKEDGLVKELLQRLEKCEQSLLEKEKDIAHMKYNINEMKSVSDRKEKKMDLLQGSNIELQNEAKVMKKLTEEMKSQFEKEIIALKDQNKILETKINSLETQIAEKTNSLKEREINEILEKQMKDLRIDLTKKLSSGHNENVLTQIEKSLIPVKNELSVLQKEWQKTFNEIRSVRSHMDKTINEKSNEIKNLTSHLEAPEELLENMNVKTLTAHVENIENVLFRYMPYVEKKMKFVWVLTDYNSHFEKGGSVSSPIFYPQLNGYCFKLFVRWEGANKENFGLFLQVLRGRNVHEDLKPFRVGYELAVLHKTGTYKICEVTLSHLDEFKADYFTILPNQQESAKGGIGFPSMFTSPVVQDYVINDTMYLTCTLKLS